MKNLILLMAVMSFSFNGFNQTKERFTIARGSSADYKVEKVITNSTDTLIYFYWGFQNQKYSQITDIGSIMITKKEDLQLLASSLQKVSEKEKGVSFEISVGNYATINLYDFANTIYISDKNGKYTTISKNKAKEIAVELQEYINFLK